MTSKHSNSLAEESSLYLRQHANNPVNWYPWGKEALEKARNQNKLIFLSVGYSACHWCHVMERESFEDEITASLLNQHFVSIKVDREERPDIDAIYMEAVQLMTGQGGWPLNVWLTPTLEPVYGGTYFPVESSHNRPGFQIVLERLAEMYKNEPDKITERAAEIRQALETDLFSHLSPEPLGLTMLQEAMTTCEKNFDELHGGFSPAPKFPSAMNIEYLLHYYHITADTKARDMAVFSLEKMCLGGIYDQIGGGFHRYSTDRYWLVPHFEKMLYDNALLLSALCDGWQVSGDPLFAQTIHQSVAFLRRELISEHGGFYAALDADSEGHEGTYYIWSYQELENLIPSHEFAIFAAYYGVHSEGNWEGNIILNRVKSSLDFSILSQLNHADFVAMADRWNDTLRAHRDQRVRPGLDTKIITSWNGMMLKALCKVWFLFPTEDLKSIILKNAEFLLRHMVSGDVVYRIAHDKKVSIPGFCDDYALLAEGLSWVFQLTGDPKWLTAAERIAAIMTQKFHDFDQSAFAYTEAGQSDLIIRKFDLFDNATPSGNSAAIAALVHISRLTGDATTLERARTSAMALSSLVGSHAMAFGYLLQSIAAVTTHHSGEIVLTGNNLNPFVQILAQKYLPFYLAILVGDRCEYSWSTLQGKTPPATGESVYVCHHFVCESPVSIPEEFAAKLHILTKTP